jgi:hypothetical protein
MSAPNPPPPGARNCHVAFLASCSDARGVAAMADVDLQLAIRNLESMVRTHTRQIEEIQIQLQQISTILEEELRSRDPAKKKGKRDA